MNSLSAFFERVETQLAYVACFLLLCMMLLICGDVFLRNVPLIPAVQGFPATIDLSEAALYLITLLPAPLLLRKGKHIRVDILLHAMPPLWAWYAEWLVDILGFACSLVFVWYGVAITAESISAGEQVIKATTSPMWLWLWVLPVVFLLMAIEFVFRMHAQMGGARGIRRAAESGH